MPLTTNAAATLIKVLNSETELAAFPVEGEVAVLFSAPLDEQNIKQFVFLVRSKATQGVINISDTDVRVLGDLATDQYDVVPYTYIFETSSAELGSRPLMRISPSEPLLPNNEYYLVSSKNMAPKFYDSAKTVSVGPSRISLKISPTANITNIPISPQTVYEITITSSSAITSGAHNIGYTLRKDGVPVVTNQTINIKADKLNLNNGVDVEFFAAAPFAVGEKFEIGLVRFTRAGTTKVQKITTYLESDLIPLPPDEESTRLTQEAILDFYEKNGFARRIGAGDVTPAPAINTTTQVLTQSAFEFFYPARFLITLSEEIDESTLSEDAFKIDIGPAFDNYLLPNMGLYSDLDKFIITYKLIEDDYGAMNTIELFVNKDLANEVPSDKKFLVQAAP